MITIGIQPIAQARPDANVAMKPAVSSLSATARPALPFIQPMTLSEKEDPMALSYPAQAILIAFTGATQRWKQAAAIVAGSLLLALSAQVSVPMIPVPMTMQTYVVLLLGVMLGWRLAGAAVLLYLLEAAIGLPVLANGGAGLSRLIGPTGGFLAAFPIAATIVGWLAERGACRTILATFLIMLLGHAVIFAGGVPWLATFVGFEKAIALGLAPFVIGTLVKSALVVATCEAVLRSRRGKPIRF